MKAWWDHLVWRATLQLAHLYLLALKAFLDFVRPMK